MGKREKDQNHPSIVRSAPDRDACRGDLLLRLPSLEIYFGFEFLLIHGNEWRHVIATEENLVGRRGLTDIIRCFRFSHTVMKQCIAGQGFANGLGRIPTDEECSRARAPDSGLRSLDG